jgi:hypothetical protein
MNMNDEESQPGKGRSRRPHKIPAEKPGPAGRLRLQSWRFVNRRQGKRDNRTAIGTDSEMGESLLLFVWRQRVFDEGIELVRVWMLPGLEEFAHSFSDAAVGGGAVLSENDAA